MSKSIIGFDAFHFVLYFICQRLQEAESRNQELTSSISQGMHGLNDIEDL